MKLDLACMGGSHSLFLLLRLLVILRDLLYDGGRHLVPPEANYLIPRSVQRQPLPFIFS